MTEPKPSPSADVAPGPPESGVVTRRGPHGGRTRQNANLGQQSRIENPASTRTHLRMLPYVYPDEDEIQRPKTFGECEAEGLGTKSNPCGFVSCKWHLYLDVLPDGRIRHNFPDREVDEIPITCALQAAKRGEHTLDECGRAFNVTRERIRQLVEESILPRIARSKTKAMRMVREIWDGDTVRPTALGRKRMSALNQKALREVATQILTDRSGIAYSALIDEMCEDGRQRPAARVVVRRMHQEGAISVDALGNVWLGDRGSR